MVPFMKVLVLVVAVAAGGSCGVHCSPDSGLGAKISFPVVLGTVSASGYLILGLSCSVGVRVVPFSFLRPISIKSELI